MNKLGIVMRDVYRKNVKSISFVILIVTPFLVMGLFYFTQNFMKSTMEINKIGVVSNEPAISQQLEKMKDKTHTFKTVTNEKEAQQQLDDEKIDAYLKLDVAQEGVKGNLYSKSALGAATELTLQQTLNQLQVSLKANALNIPIQEVQKLLKPATFKTEKVTFKKGKMTSDQGDAAVKTALSFLTTIITFMFIMTYSSIISQEIASEKGTRIMEILLSSMKAQTHYYGKLFGILLVALTQLLIYGVAFGLAYSQFKDNQMVKNFLGNVSFKGLFGKNIVILLLFMLIGIFGYAVLSALCGSLVSKPEDTAKAIQPVMYLSMIGYFLGMSMGLMDPSNIVIKITSYIPFVSSYTMPLRISTNTVNFSGVVISLVILAATVVVLTLFSAQLYKSNVLVYNDGGVLKALKQSISIMRNDRKRK